MEFDWKCRYVDGSTCRISTSYSWTDDRPNYHMAVAAMRWASHRVDQTFNFNPHCPPSDSGTDYYYNTSFDEAVNPRGWPAAAWLSGNGHELWIDWNTGGRTGSSVSTSTSCSDGLHGGTSLAGAPMLWRVYGAESNVGLVCFDTIPGLRGFLLFRGLGRL